MPGIKTTNVRMCFVLSSADLALTFREQALTVDTCKVHADQFDTLGVSRAAPRVEATALVLGNEPNQEQSSTVSLVRRPLVYFPTLTWPGSA